MSEEILDRGEIGVGIEKLGREGMTLMPSSA
jgi:hypothetical protein